MPEIKEAMKIIEEALQVAKQSSALHDIAKALAEIGEIDEALDIARKIEVITSRFYALSEIAEVLAKTGKTEEAIEIAREALDAARKITDEENYRSTALSRVAVALMWVKGMRVELSRDKSTEGVEEELEVLVEFPCDVSEILVEFEGVKVEPFKAMRARVLKIPLKLRFDSAGDKWFKTRVKYKHDDVQYMIEREFRITVAPRPKESFAESRTIDQSITRTTRLKEPAKGLGDYTLRRLAGSGAFSDVYIAEGKDGRIVAVKIYRGNEKVFIEEIGRFVQLTRALERVPYIVVPIDYGVSPRPFVVMDYYPMTLRDVIESEVELKRKLKLMYRVAKALVYAHSRGVFHGDLKPENILVSEENGEYYPWITDWGGGFTPCYSAPEVYESNGKVITSKSDVFSFGIILYEVITGEKVFVDPIIYDKYVKKREEVRVELPREELRKLINTCITRDPKQRPTIEQVEEKLLSYIVNVLRSSVSGKLEYSNTLDTIGSYLDAGNINKARERIEDAKGINLIPVKVYNVMCKITELLQLVLEYRDRVIPINRLEVVYRGFLDFLDEELREKISKDKYNLEYFFNMMYGISPEHHNTLILCIMRIKDIVLSYYVSKLSDL